MKTQSVVASLFVALFLSSCSGADSDGEADAPQWTSEGDKVESWWSAEGTAWSIDHFDDGGYAITGDGFSSTVLGSPSGDETPLENGGYFVASYKGDGSIAWVQGTGESSSGGKGYGVVTFDDGSVATTGYFGSELVLSSEDGGSVSLEEPPSGFDFFVVKYDSLGSILWARQGFSDDWAEGSDVAVAEDGGLYVSGWFEGSVIFGKGEENEVTKSCPTKEGEPIRTLFLAKYASDGHFDWVRTAVNDNPPSDSNYPEVGGLASFSDGSIAMAGTFDVGITFSGGGNEQVLYSYAADDMFISKFSSSGELLWSVQSESYMVTQAGADSIAGFEDGSVAVTGSFSGRVYFGAYEETETILEPPSDWDFEIFVARYASDGSFEWVKQVTGDEYQFVADIATWSDGSCAIVGSTQTDITFAIDEDNEATIVCDAAEMTYVAAYDADGGLWWARSPLEGDDLVRARGIASVGTEGMIVLGSFTDEATIGKGEENQASVSSEDAMSFAVMALTP